MNKTSNKITIFTDSCAGLNKNIKDRVKLIPLYVYFDENRVYNEIDGISREEFFNTLEKEQAYTSGCNPADIEKAFKTEINKGNDILVFSISSGLSSTYNTMKIVADEINEEAEEKRINAKVRVVDTKRVSGGMTLLIEKAIELIDGGLSIDEVYTKVNEDVDKIEIYFIVDDLKYLARGGRINKSIAAIGDVLNIKPILKFNEEGKIELLTKVRGLKTAIKNIDSLMREHENNRVVIAKAHNNTLCDMLIAKTGVNETVDLDLALSSHTGPNATAVIVYRK